MRRSLLVTLVLICASSTAADFEALGKSIVGELAARSFARVEERFDATMKGALPVEKLSATWDALLAQAGAFQSIESLRVQPAGAHKLVLATCVFQRGRLVVKLAIDGDGRVAGLFFLPAAEWSAPPWFGSFDEREVSVGDLPGTLSLPRGAGPFRAVVLVHGSGPNDRDESIGPNKLFKDLAGGLASRGVAVLRYDKRSLKFPQRFAGRYTVEDEVMADVRAAVDLLQKTPKIDRVFVAGHSLGGMLAPRIAAADPRVAGLVILAGTTRPLEDVIVAQLKYLGSDAKLLAAAEEAAKKIRDPKLAAGEMIDLLGARIPGSYFLDLRGYRPAEAAAKLKLPILILQGGRDYQVTADDFALWKKAPNVTLKLYPALNHQFIAGSGPSRPEEYAQPGHPPEELVREIAEFVLRK